MQLSAAAISLSAAGAAFAASEENGLAQLVSAGDDAQLAFAAPPNARDAVSAIAQQANIAINRIGAVVAALPSGVAGDIDAARAILLDADGVEVAISRRGYQHF